MFASDPRHAARAAVDLRLATPARPARPAPAPDADVAMLTRRLLARAGLDATAYRMETLVRRVPACLRLLCAESPVAALAILDDRPDLVAPALSTLLIGVTEFFRDPSVFLSLGRAVLPALPDAPLRAWSVGCSDGAELYSLAITLAELGIPAGYLLGTDCRSDAVGRARRGLYSDDEVQRVPATVRDRWFVPGDGGWEIGPVLRARTRWWTSDALSSAEPGVWDLILCRNVAIYLREEASAALWARLRGALRRGGVLVVGRAERPPGLVPLGPCLYRRAA